MLLRLSKVSQKIQSTINSIKNWNKKNTSGTVPRMLR